jgi:hypothetical protein
MKAGNKVYCIKTLKTFNYKLNNNELTHIKGNHYIIHSIRKIESPYILLIFITTENKTFLGFLIIDNNIDSESELNKIKRGRYKSWDNFNDYFVSQSQYRKMKLEKLNSI